MFTAQKFTKIIALVLLATVAAVAVWWWTQHSTSGQPLQDRQRREITIGSQTLTVEIVMTPTSLAQGLSGREQIGADGMLFIMPRRERPTFWMKDMKFDLDLIWIDDGRIVEITTNVHRPDPNLPTTLLPVYQPAQAIEWVLEIPAGQSNRLNLQVGNAVTLDPS